MENNEHESLVDSRHIPGEDGQGGGDNAHGEIVVFSQIEDEFVHSLEVDGTEIVIQRQAISSALSAEQFVVLEELVRPIVREMERSSSRISRAIEKNTTAVEDGTRKTVAAIIVGSLIGGVIGTLLGYIVSASQHLLPLAMATGVLVGVAIGGVTAFCMALILGAQHVQSRRGG